MGAEQPRDLDRAEGRDKENILYAMDFLTVQNKIISGESLDGLCTMVSAQDKTVVVIGGGDTGSDCVGTSNRLGRQEDLPARDPAPAPGPDPPEQEPWPQWPRIMRTSSSHEEGCNAAGRVMTKEFTGSAGRLEGITACEVAWTQGERGWQMKELPGTEFSMKVDVVLLAMGFVHVVHGGLIDAMGVELDGRGNVASDPDGATSREGVWAAGDTAVGASLVVRAIMAGRRAAASIDRWLRR
jgi:glutamate synthase (NADPH/NADH) small chain